MEVGWRKINQTNIISINNTRIWLECLRRRTKRKDEGLAAQRASDQCRRLTLRLCQLETRFEELDHASLKQRMVLVLLVGILLLHYLQQVQQLSAGS